MESPWPCTGSSSSRCIRSQGRSAAGCLATAGEDQRVRGSWHERGPQEIAQAAHECIEGYSISNVRAVGVTNQRETTVVWDRETGSGTPQRHCVATRGRRPLCASPKPKRVLTSCSRYAAYLSTHPSAVKLLRNSKR